MSGAAALIIVLSAYNGLEQLVADSFNNFNPDFKITATEGKSFDVSTFPSQKLQKLEGVKAVEQVVSDMVLIEYADKQYLIDLKGVDDDYVNHLTARKKDLLIDGSFDFTADSAQWSEEQSMMWENGDFGVMGSRAAGNLRLNLNSPELIKLYYPQRKHKALARERLSVGLAEDKLSSLTKLSEYAKKGFDYYNVAYAICEDTVSTINVGNDATFKRNYDLLEPIYKNLVTRHLTCFLRNLVPRSRNNS